MRGWVGPRSPGVFKGGPRVLSEIDHALALIGAAHWTGAVQSSPRCKGEPG